MDDLGLLRAEATDDVAGNADDEIAVGVAAENKMFFRVISKHKLKWINKTCEIEVATY